jgi:hypothetical protein
MRVSARVCAVPSRVEVVVSGRNLHTEHPGEAYPGIRSIRPGPEWRVTILCPRAGQSFTALGGERNHAYETANGAKADALTLSAGDHATLVREDLPGLLGEWRVERADS